MKPSERLPLTGELLALAERYAHDLVRGPTDDHVAAAERKVARWFRDAVRETDDPILAEDDVRGRIDDAVRLRKRRSQDGSGSAASQEFKWEDWN
jgi:hypothetical protein